MGTRVSEQTSHDRPLGAIDRRWLWAGVVSAAVISLAFIIRTAVVNYTTDLDAIWGTFWDFRDGTYYPVKAALDGHVPWDVPAYMANYPVGQAFRTNLPTYLVVHSPFALLGYSAAAIAMFVVNLVGIVLLTKWSLRLARFRTTALMIVGISTLVAISTAGRNVLFSGQSAILFTVGTYLALTATSERAGASGVFIALIKPTFGIPVTLLTAAAGKLKRAWRGTAAAILVAAILMIPFIGRAGGLGPMIDILIDNLTGASESIGISPETSTGRIDIPIVFARFFGIVLSSSVQNLLTLGVFGGAAWLLYRRRTLFSQGTYNDAAIVLICLAVATGIYHSVYDMIILVLPAFLLARPDFAEGTVSSRLRLAALGSILVAAFNPFKIDTIADILSGSESLSGFLGPGITAGALLAALLLAAAMVWNLPVRHSGRTERHEEVRA